MIVFVDLNMYTYSDIRHLSRFVGCLLSLENLIKIIILVFPLRIRDDVIITNRRIKDMLYPKLKINFVYKNNIKLQYVKSISLLSIRRMMTISGNEALSGFISMQCS